jgi:hypothetical protein
MNDWIRQTVSSSPISLSKIFVAPTTSAPVLVLRTFVRTRTFGICMGQRVVIRFLTLQGLCVSMITAQLKSVYGTEARTLSTVKKWHKCFADGETPRYDDPRCGRLITNDSAEAISSMLKERPSLSYRVLCRHFHIAERDLLANSSEYTWHEKVPSSLGSPCPGHESEG